MSILKTRIKELRWSRRIQQAELAEAVGVRRETIVNLESGKYNPSLKLAIDIAHYFGKSVEEIFMFIDDNDEDHKVAAATQTNNPGSGR